MKELPKVPGTFIALITAYGYLLAYVYERGYLHFFNVPSLLISVSIESIIAAVIALTTTIFGIYIYYEIAYPFASLLVKSLGEPYRKVALKILLSGAFGFTAQAFLNSFSIYIRVLIVAALILLAVIDEFFLPLIFYPKEKTIGAKISASHRQKARGQGGLLGLIPGKIFEVMFLLLIISLFTLMAGINKAHSQESFLVYTQNEHTFVLVRPTIAVEFDRESLEIGQNIKLLPSDSGIDGTVEKIGPLKAPSGQNERGINEWINRKKRY